MARRKLRINEAQIKEMYKMHCSGKTFIEIGRIFGLDRRVVKRLIEEYERRAVDPIRQSAISDLFTQHLGDMEKAAVFLLETTLPPSVTGSYAPSALDLEAEVTLKLKQEFLQVMSMSLVTRTYRDGLNPEDQGLVKKHDKVREIRALRWAEATFKGLQFHIPEVGKLIKSWTDISTIYTSAWENMTGMITQFKVRDQDAFIRTAVRVKELVDQITAKQPYTSWGQVWDKALNELNVDRKSGELLKELFEAGYHRDIFLAFYDSISQFETYFRRISDLLSPPKLGSALAAGRCEYCPL